MTASRCGAAGAVLAIASCAASAAYAMPSIADFSADTDFAAPALSPDGNQVAFVTRAQDARVLVVLDLAKRERRGQMSATVDTFEITWCSFKSNERLLCGMRGTRFSAGQPYAVTRLVAIDTSGKGKPKVLVQNGSNGASQFQDRITDWLINDPKHVLIQLTDEFSIFPNVQALDIHTGLTSVVQRARLPILYWTTDRAGVVRFGAGFDDSKSTFITRDSADTSWRTLAKWELGENDFDAVGFGPTPGTLLVTAAHNGRGAIFEMDLNEKSSRQLLFADGEVDVRSWAIANPPRAVPRWRNATRRRSCGAGRRSHRRRDSRPGIVAARRRSRPGTPAARWAWAPAAGSARAPRPYPAGRGAWSRISRPNPDPGSS